MATAFGGDPTKFRVGNHRVTWNGTDLGYTAEGSEIICEEVWRDQFGDQDGDTALDAIWIGGKVEVKLKLKEFSATNLQKALPSSTGTGGPPITKVEFGGNLAASLKASSFTQQLILHPLDKDDADLSADWTIYKAVPSGKVTVPAKTKEDMSIPIDFRVFPDQSKARGKQMLKFGA